MSIKIVKYIELRNFDFWGQAKINAELCNDDDWKALEEYFNDNEYAEVTEDEINDFFAYEDETFAQVCGYSSYNAWVTAREE